MASEVVTGGAVVGGIAAILLVLSRIGLIGKKEHTNGRSGFKPAEFWEKRFDALEKMIDVIDRTTRENRTLTQGEISGLRDLLVDIDTNLKVTLAMQAREPRA